MKAVRAALLVAGVMVVACAAAMPAWTTWVAQGEGAALYEGRRPVAARLAGHQDGLPPEAVRCANCHEGNQAIGPALTAATLVDTRARRGGPPSRYDEAALCRLLREGIDPAFVVVARAMPRYEIDAAGCAALWAHLSRR